MQFQTNLPEWKNQGAEPPERLREDGFQAGYKPPAGYFNWFWSLLLRAGRELQEKLAAHAGSADTHVTAAQKAAWTGKAEKTTASAAANGLMSAADKSKLDGIAARAEVNQNAVAYLRAGGVAVSANSKQAVIDLAAGANISLSADNNAKKVTISNTYTHPATHPAGMITGLPTSLPANGGTAANVPWSGVTGRPASFPPSAHQHDDRYFTESEINTKLAAKANLVGGKVSPMPTIADVRGCNPQLLDNADWRIRDAIVNQRGQSVYTAVGYFIDRWRSNQTMKGIVAKRTLNSGGSITFTATAALDETCWVGFQMIEFPQRYAGKTLTFSVEAGAIVGSGFKPGIAIRSDIGSAVKELVANGITSLTYTVPAGLTSLLVAVYVSKMDAGNAFTVKRCKLELGSVSTLQNEPPQDYGAELRKCQRFYLRLSSVIGGGSVGTNGIDAGALLYTPVTMRAKPSIIGLENVGNLRIQTPDGNKVVTSISVKSVYSYGISLLVSGDFATVKKEPCWLQTDTGSTLIGLSAEL